jgi:hypothetical protein
MKPLGKDGNQMPKTGAPTLYELVIERDEQRYLIMYCGNRSRRMLLDSCRKHGDKLASLSGAQELQFAPRAGEGATIGDWTIRWTGRTQRDAHAEGRLPWIGA